MRGTDWEEGERARVSGKISIMHCYQMSTQPTHRMEVTVQNPLWECTPPNAPVTTADENIDILRQAQEIKETLERIEKEDPHARGHHFHFRIHPDNLAVLEKRGFHAHWEAPYTKVTWRQRDVPAPTVVKVNVV